MYGAVLLLFGGAYFLWRWHYFGYFLPNPLYRRARGWSFDTREWAISRQRVINATWPFLVASALALASPRAWRLAIGFAIPLVGFAIVWGFFSNDMNFAGRYQYPLLPLTALSWYPPVSTLLRDLGLARVFARRKWLSAAAGLLAAVAVQALLFMQLDASRRIIRPRHGNTRWHCFSSPTPTAATPWRPVKPGFSLSTQSGVRSIPGV